MQPNLRVALIQTDLVWEDRRANLEMMDNWLDRLETPVDVVVLPEMFNTGFSMQAAALAERMDGPTLVWMRQRAADTGASLLGSLIIEEAGRYYNRLVWMSPGGTMGLYDKRHLFRMVGEDKIFTPGTDILTVRLKGWNIRPFICYDLRFPVWTRNLANAYDVAIFIANWPEKRIVYWNALLQARAIENQTWVIGVNRIGVDGNGFPHSGDSSVIDPWGNVVLHRRQEACMPVIDLDAADIHNSRSAFPAWMDADIGIAELPDKRCLNLPGELAKLTR